MATAQVGGRKPPVVYEAGKWVCPRCQNTVNIEVNMTAPPSCCNHKGGAFVIMERKKK
jgi:hypothetical protein